MINFDDFDVEERKPKDTIPIGADYGEYIGRAVIISEESKYRVQNQYDDYGNILPGIITEVDDNEFLLPFFVVWRDSSGSKIYSNSYGVKDLVLV